jgi:hypothetical protein
MKLAFCFLDTFKSVTTLAEPLGSRTAAYLPPQTDPGAVSDFATAIEIAGQRIH